MRFDQVYKLLLDRQTDINQLIVLLAEDTLREIYECIVATRAKDCLELGTGFGATAASWPRRSTNSAAARSPRSITWIASRSASRNWRRSPE